MANSAVSVYCGREYKESRGANCSNSEHCARTRPRIISRSKSCSVDDGPRKRKTGQDFIIREAEVDDELEITQQDMLPGVKDPKRWKVKCGMATGVDSQGQFQLGDVVQLDPQTVGVIVRLERENFHVMSIHGNVVKVRPQTLSKREVNENMVALDSKKNYIRKEDTVEVVDGPYVGRGGKIKYLYRYLAFVDNDGIFVCKSRHLQLVGGSKASPAAPPTPMTKGLISPCTASLMHQSGVGGPGGGGSRGGGKSAGAHHHRELIGTTIKITSGAYKGNVGIVKIVTEAAIHVELHSICQTIAVKRSHITIVVSPTKKGGFSSCTRSSAYMTGRQTPILGSQTPMYESARKPHNSLIKPTQDAGSRTPGQLGAQKPINFKSTEKIMTNTPIIKKTTKVLDMPEI